MSRSTRDRLQCRVARPVELWCQHRIVFWWTGMESPASIRSGRGAQPRVSRSWSSWNFAARCSFVTDRDPSFTPNAHERHGDGSCIPSTGAGPTFVRASAAPIARVWRWIQRSPPGAFCGQWFRRRVRVAGDARACCLSGPTAGHMETAASVTLAGDGATWNARRRGEAPDSPILRACASRLKSTDGHAAPSACCAGLRGWMLGSSTVQVYDALLRRHAGSPRCLPAARHLEELVHLVFLFMSGFS